MKKQYPSIYWNHKGKHQRIADKLGKLVPDSGECPDSEPALEAFREASNAYYDHYNNGGCNIPRDIERIFGVRPDDFGDEATAKMDAVMDEIIMAAHAEQFKKPRKAKARGK